MIMNLEEILIDTLNIDAEKARSILKSRSTKKIVYNDITILVFKREMLGYPEGTSIILDPHTRARKLVPGYPPIPRLLLIQKVKDIFNDTDVVVEEKINGYNVRLVSLNEKIISLTRGGNPCPYTHHKIMKLYGMKLKKLFNDNPDIIICGEAIGIDNPYVRYEGYKDVSFDYIIFDVMQRKDFLSIAQRNNILDSYGLKLPKIYGYFKAKDLDELLSLSVQLEEKNVEGFIIKSMDNKIRVKYTFSSTNIGDIREGMKFFFEEGKTYIFPRILREIFRQFELKKHGYSLEFDVYKELGKALLESSIQSVEKTEKGEISDEEFTLRVDDLKILDDFLRFMESLKIPIQITRIYQADNNEYVIHCLKVRRTPLRIKSILETGISPED